MVKIPARYNGPDTSGNGGWVSGLVAGQLNSGGPAAVMLKLPPPLDVELEWDADEHHVYLKHPDGSTIASATQGAFTGETPGAPSIENATTGMENYAGHEAHPFNRCFTCGTQRGDGDGLRIFSGPYDSGTTAATWTPHTAFDDGTGHVAPEVSWAALDCPGGWAANVGDEPAVLGSMTAHIIRRPRTGEPCLVRGVLMASSGRKRHTATALYTRGGELLGRAEHVWIQIDPAKFTGG